MALLLSQSRSLLFLLLLLNFFFGSLEALTFVCTHNVFILMRIFNSIFPVRFNFNALKFNIPQKLSHFIFLTHNELRYLNWFGCQIESVGSIFFTASFTFSNKLSCFFICCSTLLHQFRSIAEQNCFVFRSFFLFQIFKKIHIGRRIYQKCLT